MTSSRPSSNRRFLLWTTGLLFFLITTGVFAWYFFNSFTRDTYYQQLFSPVKLSQDQVVDYAEQTHLANIPWMAYSLPVSHSASLQMIAAQHGSNRTRQFFDFITGTTYSVSTLPGQGFYPASHDPDVGLAIAAPILGLTSQYYVTNNAQLYLQVLRSFISQGYPVCITLDKGSLYGQPALYDQSELLIGYDQQQFYYYEPVCLSPASCRAGEHAPGERGQTISEAQILTAVLNQSRAFHYPWKYALTVFEPGVQRNNLITVWERNGNLILHNALFAPPSSQQVLTNLAKQIEGNESSFNPDTLATALAQAARLRQEDSNFLRQAFPNQMMAEQAATQLSQAADDYQAGYEIIQKGMMNQATNMQVASKLRQAAEAEGQAGQLFINLSHQIVNP